MKRLLPAIIAAVLMAGVPIASAATVLSGQQINRVWQMVNNASQIGLKIIGASSSMGLVSSGSLLIDSGGAPTFWVNAASRIVGIKTRSPKNELEVIGAISGSTMYVRSMSGAGLTDCDDPTASKLLWDATTERYSCGADQSGAGGSPEVGTASFSGAVLILGNARYVLKQGDTMTGALTINLSSGFIGLKVLQTASGAFMHAEKGLSSSGTLVWDGAGSGASLWVSTFDGAGLVDCDLATQTLAWDATAKRFSCGTDSDTTYTFGQGLTTNGTNIRLSDSISGTTLKIIGTASGNFIHAEKGLSSSGTLVWEGAASGSSLYVATALTGIGLTDCDAAGQTLAWDASTGRFSCGTDADSAAVPEVGTASYSGGVLRLGDPRYVNTSGDTMTGALNILNGKNLQVAGSITGATLSGATVYADTAISGAIIHARTALRSSGTLIVDGAAQFNTTITHSAGSFTKTSGDFVMSSGDFSVTSGAFDVVSGDLTVTNGGIFTANGPLEIDGDSTLSGNLLIDLSSPGTSIAVLDVAGGVPFAVVSDTSRVGIGTNAPETKLEVIGTISGTSLKISGNVVHSLSGTLVAEAFSGTTIEGANLKDCDTAGTSKLLWDVTTKKFSCGTDTDTDTNTTYTAGKSLTLTVTAFSLSESISGTTLKLLGNMSGNTIHAEKTLTSSGGLVWEGAASGASLYVATSFTGVGLEDCDADGQTLAWNASTGRFLCGDDDGGAAAPEVGTASFSGAVLILGNDRWVNDNGDTMTGALVIDVTSGNGNTLGLRVLNTGSGRHLHAEQTLTSSGTIVVEGAFSGATMYVATSFDGAGLTDCDAATQKLNWDATAKRFSCSTDDDVPESGDFAAAGDLDADGTITDGVIDQADLTADILDFTELQDTLDVDANTVIIVGSNTLGVAGALSGTILHAEQTLTSSGSLVWEGTGSGNKLFLTGLASFSGALRLENSLTGATINGFGLGNDCDGSGLKLTWDVTTERFKCEADQGGSGGGISYAAAEGMFVNQGGDTMTGALNIDITGGNGNTLGLRIINTGSGRHLHAEQILTSSGGLTWEGTATGKLLYAETAISGALIQSKGNLRASGALVVDGLVNLNANMTFGDTSGDFVTVVAASWIVANDTNFALSGGNNALSFDTDTLSIDASANAIGILTTSPQTPLEVVGTMSGKAITIGPVTYSGVVIKPVNEGVSNSNVFQSDDHLQFNAKANKTYWVEVAFQFQSTSSSSDFKYRWLVPTGTRASTVGVGSVTQITTPIICALTGASYCAMTSTSTPNPGVVHIEGVIDIGSTAGTVALQWAQVTALSTELMRVATGATLFYREIQSSQ